MAEISLIDQEEFRAQCQQMEEVQITAQIIMQSGIKHALIFLQEHGVTPENVEAMIENVDKNLCIIQQIAAERGYAGADIGCKE